MPFVSMPTSVNSNRPKMMEDAKGTIQIIIVGSPLNETLLLCEI